ncbi:MAG: SulP family inorganic anion transporter [Myxococcales bacterium]|nr:SulP family inorganic anion transporter [Myxococcales bacterium]
MQSSTHHDSSEYLAYWRGAARATITSWRDAFSSGVGSNIVSGVTVALVALPLNMALAIACGLPASVGLVTGAIAGVLGALLGGARLQITGPEVALAPITFEIVAKHGFSALLIVTLMAGAIQILLGLLRVGRLVHAIPVPVIAGFLAAVGVMVFDSQLPVLLGVSEQARVVTELTPSILRGISGATIGVGLAVVAVMLALPKLAPRAPTPLVALALGMLAVALFDLPVAMVDEIDGGFHAPSLPTFAGAPLGELALEAVALALIASIDSLLCAVSIDARTGGSRTRSDQELVAQGVANIGSACFGGMPVAAAIVRSAAAVEAGATSRIAPLVQSLLLALVVIALAPLMDRVPLVALASILMVVGYKLIDWELARHMWKGARFEVGVLAATAAGILLTDFVIGVLIGVLASLVEFAHRQRSLLRTHRSHSRLEADGAHVLHLEGPLFFASQAKLDRMTDDIGDEAPVIIDLAAVPMLDSSGAQALSRAIEALMRSGNEVWLSALSDEARTLLAPTFEAAGERLRAAESPDIALRSIARRGRADDNELDPPSSPRGARQRRFAAPTLFDRP